MRVQAFKEYLANPPDKVKAFGGSSSDAARAKSAQDKQDKKIMALLEEEGAKRRAAEEAKAAEKREVDVEGIAKEWATKEYTLRMLNGDIDNSLSEKDFLGKRAAYDDGKGGATRARSSGRGKATAVTTTTPKSTASLSLPGAGRRAR